MNPIKVNRGPNFKIKQIEELQTKLTQPTELDEEAEIRLREFSPLSYKERIFVQEFCKHGIARQAAIAAGVPPKSSSHLANRWLNEPHIQIAILKRQQAISNLSIINREWVMLELAQIIEDLKSTNNPDLGLHLKALDMINKMAGFYNDQSISIGNTFNNIEIKIVKNDEPKQIGQ